MTAEVVAAIEVEFRKRIGCGPGPHPGGGQRCWVHGFRWPCDTLLALRAAALAALAAQPTTTEAS